MSASSWQQIEHQNRRWWIEPDWQDRLLSQGELRLPEWHEQGVVEVVKNSLHRTIYRIDLPERPVFIKHYPVRDWRGWLRQRLRPAKAWKEWQQTRLLSERAIPTITPLAVGIYPSGESYFISEEIDGAVQLYEYLQRHWRAWQSAGKIKECQKLAQELGEFLARMYQAGIAHRDLHPWNVLIRCFEDGSRRWFLIDPYEIKNIASPRRPSESGHSHLLRSFTLMSLALWPMSTLNDRLRCWHSFCRACTPEMQLSKEESRLFLSRLAHKVAGYSFVSWKSRSHRCVKTNREFYQVRTAEGRAWVNRQVPQEWIKQVMADPEAVFRAPTTKILKNSRSAEVGLIQGPCGRDDRLLIKKFTPRNNLDRWLSCYRSAPALHCYQMAYRLDTAYLPTARPLAAIEQRSGSLTTASYLLTEYVANTVDLATFFIQGPAKNDHTIREVVLCQIVDILRRLHEYKLSHRDLKAVNILVRDPDSKKPQALLIDLRGVHYHRWLMRSRRIKDLARLALSAVLLLKLTRTELLRGLCRYLGNNRHQWRWWWRGVQGQVQEKIRQNEKRGRILS